MEQLIKRINETANLLRELLDEAQDAVSKLGQEVVTIKSDNIISGKNLELGSAFSVTTLAPEDYIYGTAKLMRKVNNKREYFREYESMVDSKIRVEKIIHLEKEHYNILTDNLCSSTLAEGLWEEEFGGCSTEPPMDKIFPELISVDISTTDFYALLSSNKEVKEYWYDNLFEICVLIKCLETKQQFLVSPQGSCYCRYSAFIFNEHN